MSMYHGHVGMCEVSHLIVYMLYGMINLGDALIWYNTAHTMLGSIIEIHLGSTQETRHVHNHCTRATTRPKPPQG